MNPFRTKRQRMWETRQAVLSKWGLICFYCGDVLQNPTLDHLVPSSKGGKFTLANLVPACDCCNRAKGNLSVEEYRMLVYRNTAAGKTCALIAEMEAMPGLFGVELESLKSIKARTEWMNPKPIFAGEMRLFDVGRMVNQRDAIMVGAQ